MSSPESPVTSLEALIFSGGGPVGQAALRRALGWSPGQIAAGVAEINTQLEQSGRPYEIIEVAGGYQFRTRPEFGELLASAHPERRVRLSRAALDTLAVVAYRQPVSRPEIEETRSVDCGAVLRSLLERDLVRVVGRRDAPGRPALYGTTAHFLETFGLKSVRDLPDLRDLLPTAPVEGTPIEDAIAASAEALATDLDGEAPLDEAWDGALDTGPEAAVAPRDSGDEETSPLEDAAARADASTSTESAHAESDASRSFEEPGADEAAMEDIGGASGEPAMHDLEPSDPPVPVGLESATELQHGVLESSESTGPELPGEDAGADGSEAEGGRTHADGSSE